MASRSSEAHSKQVLFIQDFSISQDVQNIRSFFRHQTGGNLPVVEFYKESGDKFFLALRFDNKDQAKDIRKKFDGKEVLGDVITMRFFKNNSKGQDANFSSNKYDDRDHNGYRENSRVRKSGRDASPYKNGYESGKHTNYRKDSESHLEKNDRPSRNRDKKRHTGGGSYDSSDSDSNHSPVNDKKPNNARSSSSSSDSSDTKSKSKSKKKLKRKNRSQSPPAEENLRNNRYSPTKSRSRSKSPLTSKSKKHKVPEITEEDIFTTETYISHDITVEKSGNYVISETENGQSSILMKYDYLSSENSAHIFDELMGNLHWEQKINHGANGKYSEPRKSVWFGDVPYKYAGSIQEPTYIWHPLLVEIRRKLEASLNYEFNSVLCNLYRHGMDSIGWHADNEPQLGRKPLIASVNLGCTRTFLLKRKTRYAEGPPRGCKFLNVKLTNGSLCVMKGATQLDWLHSVPKEHEECYPRINLTFRYTHPLHSAPHEREQPRPQERELPPRPQERELPPRSKKERYEVSRDEEYNKKKRHHDSDHEYDRISHSPKHTDRSKGGKHLKSAITADHEMDIDDRHVYKRNRSVSSPENSDVANSDSEFEESRHSNHQRESIKSNRRRKNSESSDEEPVQKKSASNNDRDRKSKKHKDKDSQELRHSREKSSSKVEKQNKPEPMEEDVRVDDAEEILPVTEESYESTFEFSELQRMIVRKKQVELERGFKQDVETMSNVVKLLINKEPSLEEKLHKSLHENLLDCAQRYSMELSELINKVKLQNQTT